VAAVEDGDAGVVAAAAEKDALVAIERVGPLVLEAGRHGGLLDKVGNVRLADPICGRGHGVERAQRVADRDAPRVAVKDARVDV